MQRRDPELAANLNSLLEADALQQLGGAMAFHALPSTQQEIHLLVQKGFPISALKHFLDQIEPATRAFLLTALRVSNTRIEHGTKTQGLLNPRQSDLLWKMVLVFCRARALLGNQVAAESWVVAPIPALDHQTPLQLVASATGAAKVEDYLGRLDYGVYT